MRVSRQAIKKPSVKVCCHEQLVVEWLDFPEALNVQW